MAEITLKNLSKSFGSASALKDISLDIHDGEFVALLGASGCGKSTLLRIIAGLERQDSGEIYVDGARIDGLRPATRDIAMVFQSYALYPHMTVAQNIASPLRIKRLAALERLPLIGSIFPSTKRKISQIRRDVEQVAGLLEITPLLERKPEKLSGGQRQRVAIGRAVVRQPKIFLMDEPLSNLDYNLRMQMRNELVELHQRLRATIIYITHDQAEAMTMADKIAVMRTGEILQVGTPAEIYGNPSCQAVAEFVGNPHINLVRGDLRSDGIVQSGKFLLPLVGSDLSQPVTIAVRPEALIVGPPSEEGWCGSVVRVEHLGSELIVRVQLDEGLGQILIRSDPFGAVPLHSGSRISVRPRAEHVIFFNPAGHRLTLKMYERHPLAA